MIPQKPKKTTSKRSLSDFNESLSLLLNEINEMSDAYFDLVEISDNTYTAKAESYLLYELGRLCDQVKFKTDNLDSNLTIVKPD